MRLVLLESPFSGDVGSHIDYGHKCMRDCLMRGEAPFASHLLYTQTGVLDDDIVAERQLGMAAGQAWGSRADATVVYCDFGITLGMDQGIKVAEQAGRPIEYRRLLR